MKHINESIIGRKGTDLTKLWLLYPISKDYSTALEILPKGCRIYWDSTVLFCVNRQQLKEFFNRISNKYYMNGYTHPESVLFEINPRYLKNFEDVKNWIVRLSSTEEIGSLCMAKETNLIIVNVPEYIKSL